MSKKLRSWLPLILLLGLLILFFSLRLDKYLTFTSLRENRATLISWTKEHFFMAALLYMSCYTLAVAASVPGAVFLTLAGGFLFGVVFGTVFVIVSATLGATALFFAVRTSFGDWLAKSALSWLGRMREGFQQNAFSYLLMLRLVPLFPFWVVNIVPALLGVDAKTFIITTFFGILPGSIVYVMVGNGLSHVFEANQTPNLGIIFDIKVLLPLLALAALSFIPILYKRVNPKEQKKNPKTNQIKCDLSIIGAGAGGLSVAAVAAQLGLKVVLLESGKMGGDCLNYGCVPSKSLLAAGKIAYQLRHAAQFGISSKGLEIDFKKVMQQVHAVIKVLAKNDSVERFESLGVQVIKAVARFSGVNTLVAQDRVIEARRIVIATGSSPFKPPIPGLEDTPYLTNETIFNLTEQPKHLIVIGGGPIGCELAQAFSMLGSKITLIEGFNLLPKDDVDCVAILRAQLKAMGIIIHEQAKVLGVEPHAHGGIKVSINQAGEKLAIRGSHLLIATGRRANVENLDLEKAGIVYSNKGIEVNSRLQTSNRRVYALGDVVGPYQFTHMATYQAGIVLRNIAFKIPAKVDYRAIPWVTYTLPEIAHVGLLAEEALKHADIQFTEWSFLENDRAQTEHSLEGKIKIISDKKGRVLGVTIVGAHAGELILPWVIAIREKRTLRSFTDAVSPYPTLSEISKRVAGEFYKSKLFSNKTRWLVGLLKKLG
ncbi:MAG: FAD-dependent oxidoreductase [Tatlockia sp.]|nr:FAD-dependent oxidoreductase [Tatlockia sp.]